MISKSRLTQTPISPQRKKMEEDFWYPQKALEKADRLAPVPTLNASKRQHRKIRPIRFEHDFGMKRSDWLRLSRARAEQYK